VQCLEQSGGRIQQIMVPELAPSWKRWLDLTCIALASPALLPIMLALAALIKCVSRGPVFFRQERIGFRGERFTILKFRTMQVNADTRVHQDYLNDLVNSGRQMVKLDSAGDKRLIPFGGFIRSAGLDELPQILNVLRGDMSLVGPRPCTPHEASLYAEWQKKRFSALPGLTGLWQVRGKNKTTFHQMICLDIYYATSMHLRMDLEIMVRTVQPIWEQVKEFLSLRRRRVAAQRASAAPVEPKPEPMLVLAEQPWGK
jgi:lipopolysaccharide/colanic/teichoic acid biosynthesis glycosyltransferase